MTYALLTTHYNIIRYLLQFFIFYNKVFDTTFKVHDRKTMKKKMMNTLKKQKIG